MRTGEIAVKGKLITVNWLDECRMAADATPKDTRQDFIDLIFEGKTLGEARDQLNISLEAACGIINRNIVATKHYTLNKMDKE